MPRLSWLIPVYRPHADWLRACLHSCLSQSLAADYEVVLVDDGNQPEISAALDTWGYINPRIRVVHLPRNLGVAHALNAGWAACRAPVICRMDCDDVALPERLDRQFPLIESGRYAIVGGRTCVLDEEFEMCGCRRPLALPIQPWRAALRRGQMPFGHPTWTMHRKNVEAAIGRREPYPLDYPWAEDFALLCELARTSAEIVDCETIVTAHRMHPDRSSALHSAIQRKSRDKARAL